MSNDVLMDEGSFEVDPRYQRLAASSSVRSVWDALEELLTNCHDSYGNLGEATRIRIEVQHGHGENRFVRVSDRAEGMSHEDLFEKMTRPGRKSAAEGARGFMGRGAKDIVAIGDVEIETIHEGRFSRLKLTAGFGYERFKPRDATVVDRNRLGVKHNGTVVTLRPREGVSLPRHASLRDRLPRLVALRDIFDVESDNRVMLVDVGASPETSEKLEYRGPAATQVFDETFEVDPEDYPGVTAKFSVWRTTDRIEAPRYGSPFDEAGFLICAQRAIHERTFFDSKLENDPLSRFYYGRIEVPYLDELCSQFDAAQVARTVSQKNPTLIIDPDRNEGLAREHPFTQSLLDRPAEVFEEILESHRKEMRETERQLEDRDLRRRLNELERLTSDFIRDELFETPSGDTPAVLPALPPTRLELIPFGFSVEIGSRKTLTLRAPKGRHGEEPVQVSIAVDENALVPVRSTVTLEWDEDRGYLHTTVAFDARTLCDAAIITAKVEDGEVAEALGSVLPTREERMEDPLEFARSSAALRLNRPMRLELLAKRQLVEDAGTRVHVGASNSDFTLRGQYVELQETRSGHFRASIRVAGKRTGSTATVWARLGEHEATCDVSARDRKLPPQGGVSIKLVDKDLGIFRGQFSREIGNLLEISVRHDSVARYLRYGAATDTYHGQLAVQFRILLAEIVAESVAHKLMLEGEDGDQMYQSAAQFTYAQHEIFNKFVGKAHRIMVPDSEARRLLSEG